MLRAFRVQPHLLCSRLARVLLPAKCESDRVQGSPPRMQMMCSPTPCGMSGQRDQRHQRCVCLSVKRLQRAACSHVNKHGQITSSMTARCAQRLTAMINDRQCAQGCVMTVMKQHKHMCNTRCQANRTPVSKPMCELSHHVWTQWCSYCDGMPMQRLTINTAMPGCWCLATDNSGALILCWYSNWQAAIARQKPMQ